MSHIRTFSMQLRRLSTCQTYMRPALSAEYKSKDMWDDRFDCTVLSGDQNLIKLINTKIMSDLELTNLEVDVFINIAAPRKKDLAQLQEAVKTLRTFRKSLHAHTLLPSSSHAICRLFLDSDKLSSLVRLLERRIEFGIFPDPMALNILFDQALELEQYAIASRLAALIMLQEEFGSNAISDNFALYSVAKYIETQTDFSDWIASVSEVDPILSGNQDEEQVEAAAKAMEKKKKEASEEDEDEEEEDAEYIRIPFLRNPYNDNHFDLTNPRQICGKTLSMLGLHLMSTERALGAKCQALGELLQARWTQANEALNLCVQSKVSVDQNFVGVAKFYLENLNNLDAPDDQVEQSLLSKLDKLPRGGLSLSAEADARYQKLKDQSESEDIKAFRQSLKDWSNLRIATREAIADLEKKKKLIEEIKAKKRELKHREEYLFFYDNLKKKNLSRISYD